jgi:hypothetical protein
VKPAELPDDLRVEQDARSSGVTFRLYGRDWSGKCILFVIYSRYDRVEVRRSLEGKGWSVVHISDQTRQPVTQAWVSDDRAVADYICSLFQRAIDVFDFDTIREPDITPRPPAPRRAGLSDEGLPPNEDQL